MSKENLYLGRRGEEIAINFLRESGYKILKKNYKIKLGEIDIIAKDKDTFCFIEVKTRHSDRFGLPQEAVSAKKQRQMIKCALAFLKENRLLEEKARFDVVLVIHLEFSPKLSLIKNAFQMEGQYAF